MSGVMVWPFVAEFHMCHDSFHGARTPLAPGFTGTGRRWDDVAAMSLARRWADDLDGETSTRGADLPAQTGRN